MSKTFITSDQHFGHQSIISLCNRPFKSVDEMNNHMVHKWNSAVRPADTVYHLGDLFWHIDVAKRILPRLNGTIRLIKGNHDYWLKDSITRSGGDMWERIELLPPIHRLNFNRTKLYLCHYPMRAWEGNFGGAMQLFGHVHATLNADRLPRTLDVGVDSIGYVPWSIEKVWAHLMKDDILPEELRVSDGLSYTEKEKK